MKNGFYNELEELRQEGQNANFGFLKNIDVTDESSAYAFLHGVCDEFAVMLSDIYGYEIETVRNGVGRLIHAYCISQIGDEKAYIDVRGITTDAELFFNEFKNELYYCPDGRIFVEDEEGCEVVAEKEVFQSKNELFEGEYEDWEDDNIKDFILSNAAYYNTEVLTKNQSLDIKIKQASSRTVQSSVPGNDRVIDF